MNKNKTPNTIKDCFDIILGGNKEDSRLAARRVRKLLYSEQGEKDKYKQIKDIVESASGNYAAITEDWRQENFVTAVSVIYYLGNRKKEPDFLFPWFFLLLRHSKGNIRYAAVRMFAIEIWPLTVHIRHSDFKRDRLSPKQANIFIQSLAASLHELSETLYEPKYKRYKYIDSLPASPYKSVQMVVAELEDSCRRE